MGRKKRILIIGLVLLAVIILIVCLCTKKCSGGSEESGGKIINAGKIKAFCPDGWVNYPIYDAWSDDGKSVVSDSLCFIKSDSPECDAVNYPSITINYYGEDNTVFDMRSMYKNVTEVSFTAGSVTWEGFVGEYGGHKSGMLTKKDSAEIGVSGYLSAGDSSFDFEDGDVKRILSSIEIVKDGEK